MGFQPGTGLDLLDPVPQGLLHEVESRLVGLGLLLGLFLRALLNLLVQHGAEFLVLVGPQGLGAKLVHLLGEVENLRPRVLQSLGLGELVNLVRRVPGGVVNIFLVLLHPGHVLVQGDGLFLRGGVEEEQVLQKLPLCAVAVEAAHLQLAAEVLVELLVPLPVLLEHPGRARL